MLNSWYNRQHNLGCCKASCGLMVQGQRVERRLLRFDKQAEVVRADLSAIAHTPEGHLWIGSDELTTIDRLSPTLCNGASSEYGDHQQYSVGDYINLADSQSEIDIEGLDVSEGYLWLVGSHSCKRKKPKGKNAAKDIERLKKIDTDVNRYVLARIPLVNGEPVREDPATGRSAACLEKRKGQSALLEMLADDPHIGLFLQLGLPSKENGLDIEAIAAKGNQLFLGLRGPVLRGMAIILEITVEATSSGGLTLKKLKDKQRYHKHFVDLNGLGVRDLCFQNEDLLILAGPTMSIQGQSQLFRLKDPLQYQRDTLFTQPCESLAPLFSLPQSPENAEGITLFPSTDNGSANGETTDTLLVVYDSPKAERLKGKQAIWADMFLL